MKKAIIGLFITLVDGAMPDRLGGALAERMRHERLAGSVRQGYDQTRRFDCNDERVGASDESAPARQCRKLR